LLLREDASRYTSAEQFKIFLLEASKLDAIDGIVNMSRSLL
jgi:hypothetical protein